jgi:hypothetical protein
MMKWSTCRFESTIADIRDVEIYTLETLMSRQRRNFPLRIMKASTPNDVLYPRAIQSEPMLRMDICINVGVEV